MKLSGFKYIGFAPLAILLCLVVWVPMSEAWRTAQESAQRALFVEAAQLLDDYHDRHGRYPDSLDALQLTFPDGGDKSTLAKLNYKSDGEHYTLSAHIDSAQGEYGSLTINTFPPTP